MFTYFVSFVIQAQQSPAQVTFDMTVEVPTPVTDQTSLDQLREGVRAKLKEGGMRRADEILAIINFILLKEAPAA